MSTSDEKKTYVVFVMNNCKYCSDFLKKLSSKPDLMKKFNVVDVEKIPSIPDEVDEVPAVYNGKTVYSGKNAFKFLNEIMSEYLLPAEQGMSYSFLDGNDESIFSSFSLLNQLNGSNGIGDSVVKTDDPTRMMKMSNDSTNKNTSLESIIASRDADIRTLK